MNSQTQHKVNELINKIYPPKYEEEKFMGTIIKVDVNSKLRQAWVKGALWMYTHQQSLKEVEEL